MRSTSMVLSCLVMGLAGCRALEVPPPPGAGSIQGTVVFTAPGGAKTAAGGASIELLGTALVTTADPTTGFFTLGPIPSTSGTLLIRYDSDHDGKPDHDRSFSLESRPAPATARS